MKNHETNEKMFEYAIAIEKIQQDFYHKLVEMFSFMPDVSSFWKGMMQDEICHARTLKKIQSSLHPKQLRTPANPTILRKAKELLLMSVEDEINSIHTLNDAFEMALQAENSEFNTIFEFLVNEYASSEETRKFALLEIEEHLIKLSKFSRSHGDPDWRKSISVREKKPAI